MTKCGVDTSLGSYRVRTGREQFGDTGGLKAVHHQTERSSQTGTASADDHSIVVMIDHLVTWK